MFWSVCQVLVLSLLLAVLVSCGGEKEPASPLETFKIYVKAVKMQDTTTMKLLLSSETIKMHEAEAKAQGVTLDDIVKRETLLSEGQKKVEFRNERIEGDRATLEIKNTFGIWETIPFIFEDGAWKIDKKGYADILGSEIEEMNRRQIDDAINQGRPDALLSPSESVPESVPEISPLP